MIRNLLIAIALIVTSPLWIILIIVAFILGAYFDEEINDTNARSL